MFMRIGCINFRRNNTLKDPDEMASIKTSDTILKLMKKKCKYSFKLTLMNVN